MELLRRGSRLSVTPVTATEFRTIQKLGEKIAGKPGEKSGHRPA
jgi:predicted RNA-binding protein with PUA-like domain